MAEPKPLKSHASYQLQLTRLRDRGLHVVQEKKALATLERLGYYRLSGYFYPMRETKPYGQVGRLDTFQAGAHFELVEQLAEFDKRLRLIVMYAIETIELATRVAIAHHLGQFDPEAHLNPKLLDGRFTRKTHNGEPSQHDKWLERYEKMLKDSKEDFVIHHNSDYGAKLPIWVGIELWDFGMLSRFFAGMESRDRNRIAMKLGADTGEVLKSWLKAFNFVRNVVAHHSRLWNRRSPEIPILPSIEKCRWLAHLHSQPDTTSKVFGLLSCMLVLVRKVAPESDWLAQLKLHLQTFPDHKLLSLQAAGFPDHWQELPLWQPNPN
jgi:abortive infection bacteriophage resistance protein